MKVPSGLGLDQKYLETGRDLAKKALGKRYVEAKHPVTPKEIVTFAEKSYASAAMRYTPYYMRLMEASAWRYAQHGLRVNPMTWTFETIPVESRIPRPHLALVGDKVEAVKAEFLKSVPVGTVLPKDNTPFNRRGAELARAKLDQKNEEDRIDAKLDLAADCCITWGDIYAEVVLDHTNAKTVELPIYMEAQMGDGTTALGQQSDADGNPITQTLRLADESTNLIFAPQIFFNQSATSLDDCRIAHSHVFRDMDWAMSEWPEYAQEMKTAGIESEAGHFQGRLQNLMLFDTWSGAGSGTYSGVSGFDQEACLVHVIRMNPDNFYPLGRFFVVVAGVTVVCGPLPFGKLMLVHWGYSPVPNSIISHGLVKDLIGLNRHLEQMAHQAAMSRRTLGVPFVMSPERSGGDFAGKTLAMGYGQNYVYRQTPGGGKPEIVYPHGTMDAGFVKEMEFFLGEFFERASGVRPGMEGNRPAGVYPAAMMRMIISQNLSRFVPKMNNFRKFIEQLYSYRLEAMVKSPAAQFPTKAPYPGGSTHKLWLEFSAQDMGDNVTYRIETTSAAAIDPAARMQDIIQFLTVGVLNPMDPKTQHAILREANLQSLISDMQPDVGKADDENALMAAGEQVQIGPFENDALHLQVHVDWINSSKFWLMEEDRQMATIMHARDHEDRMKIKAQEEIESAQSPTGMPSFDGGGQMPEGSAPPSLTPGNGVPGLPQTSVAAQQAPKAGMEPQAE